MKPGRKRVPSQLVRDMTKRLKKLGLKKISRFKIAGIPSAINQATERLAISGKIKRPIGPTESVQDYLKSLSKKEYDLVLSEAASILHGELDYSSKSNKIPEIFSQIDRISGGVVVHEIGASTGSWMAQVLKRARIKPKLLYQTNISHIPRKVLETLEYNPIYQTGVNILDKDLAKKAPGKAHIAVVKDVLKFINRRKRGAAVKNVSKLLTNGGILIVGSAMIASKEMEAIHRLPYIIDETTKLSLFVKRGNKLVRVHPDRFIDILRKSRSWEEYLDMLEKEKASLRIPTRTRIKMGLIRFRNRFKD